MNLFKEDTRHLEGNDVPFKNIAAVQELSSILRTCMGPNGMGKLVVTHLGKTVISRSTGAVLANLEVEHPVAKLIVMASENQAAETGDHSTIVIALAGEILENIKNLLEMKLSIKDIIQGLEMAQKKALELMPALVCHTIPSLSDEKEVIKVMLPVVGSKTNGFEQVLTPLIAKACIDILPQDPTKFNVENIRVAKILGGAVQDSCTVKGFLLARDTEGSVKHIQSPKIAVFGCAIDKDEGETKGTIVLHNAAELQSYTLGEEMRMKNIIDEIASSGANVIATGQTYSEYALHYIEQHRMMAIKIPSKFELRRFCLAVGATALVRLGAPTQEELGHCHEIGIDEIGETRCIIVQHLPNDSINKISSIVIRGGTQAALDELERVIIDAVNLYKVMTKEPRFFPGGGAFEMQLSQLLHVYGKSIPGLHQYAIGAVAEALTVIPKTLAENAGLNFNDTLSQLRVAHAQGRKTMGVNVEGGILDMAQGFILDNVLVKEWAIKYAIEAVITAMQVDQIIMAKPSGGPKPQGMKTGDPED